MQKLEPKHTIQRIEKHHEVHYVVSGLYDPKGVRGFLTDLSRAAYPFVANGKSWSVLGDLTHFVPQQRETTEVITQGVKEGEQYGLVRLAYVNPPPLVSSQHRRMAGNVDVQIFKTKPDALRWLRWSAQDDDATADRAAASGR